MSTGKTLLALALSALLPAGAAWAANNDTLIYCSEASPESFNPQIASSGPSFVASSQVLYNRLINFDPVKNTPVPSLAESWTISPDGKTYTFTLRKGVKFNSNKYFKPTRDFNADDVIFSVMRQKDPKHPYHNVSQGNYEYFNDVGLDKLIQDVKKVDDYHVQFTLSEPNAAFLADWGMDFASILSAEYADAMLKKGTPENVDTWPIGTGPYVLQQYKVDSLIRYVANPNYWDGEVPTKHLIFSITPNVETRLAKLQTNECQIIPAPSPVQFEVIKKNKDLTLHSVDALNVGYLAFNTEKKPFDNVLVRQALNYATDKKAIVNAVFMGSGTAAKSPIPPNMMGFNNELKDYSYDPEKAKALLKQAGMDSYIYMQFMVSSLYSTVLKELGDAGICAELVFENPVEEYKKLIGCETIGKAIGVLGENLKRICQYVGSQKSGVYSRPVVKALAYMEENYSSPALSMEDTAVAAGLSSARFSTSFKSETGVTFTDYLLKLRMEKAKDLMRDPNRKIYEIAMMTGYSNIPYFSTAFKKYTGCPPSEYREKQHGLQGKV